MGNIVPLRAWQKDSYRYVLYLAAVSREGLLAGVTCTRLVDMTIKFFNMEPRIRSKLNAIRRQEEEENKVDR